VALATTMIALAISASVAHAASTRAEYVAQVDPICQTELAQEKAVIRPATKQVKHLEDQGFDPDKPSKPIGRVVARSYDRLAAVQRDADGQIAAVVSAPGDEAVVTSWLQQRATFTQLFQRAGQLFAHQRPRRFFRLLLKALAVEGDAERSLHEFRFASCGQIVPGF
jgi:hypothetical protein